MDTEERVLFFFTGLVTDNAWVIDIWLIECYFDIDDKASEKQ